MHARDAHQERIFTLNANLTIAAMLSHIWCGGQEEVLATLQAAYDSGFRDSSQYHELQSYVDDLTAMVQVEEGIVEEEDDDEVVVVETEEADGEEEGEGSQP